MDLAWEAMGARRDMIVSAIRDLSKRALSAFALSAVLARKITVVSRVITELGSSFSDRLPLTQMGDVGGGAVLDPAV